MEPFFAGDSYDTPDDAPRFLGDRLTLNTRWYFAGEYIREVFRSRSMALKGLYERKAWAESSYRVFKIIEGCGGRFHLRGMDNIRLCQPPVVFISNHMSTLETMTLPCMIAPFLPVTFVVKESLVTHPLFGPVMRSRDPITVGRKNPREDFQTVMTRGKELLAQGISLIIFPQSTRSAEFIPEVFNSLGVKLARAAGVQIMPVAVKTDFWGNGKDVHKKVIDFITGHLRQWGAIIKK